MFGNLLPVMDNQQTGIERPRFSTLKLSDLLCRFAILAVSWERSIHSTSDPFSGQLRCMCLPVCPDWISAIP